MKISSYCLRIVTAVSVLTLSSCFSTPRFANRPWISSPSSSNAFRQSTALAAQSLVVISPPGGVGEVAAVKAAEMGASVRWFVVSPSGNQQVVLSQEALDSIAEANGSVELAGADAPSLLLPSEDSKSAVQAVSTWCGAADAMVCTFDGVEDAAAQGRMPDNSEESPQAVWKNAIKMAAKEASSTISGMKVAVLPPDDEGETSGEEESSGLGGLVGKFIGGDKVAVPSTLAEAMATDASKLAFLRHGQLFGTPESSPNFSALVGGPRRDPESCEEYQKRSVRVDPTLSVSGNLMMGSSTRSSRHSVGEAAALMALGKVPVKAGLDVCVSSQRGTDATDIESWEKEFQRIEKMISSGEGAQLFSADFASVPDVERLADWLATKWAPAVLRTYDIAAIRIGARPVYAVRAGDGKVEIVWQQLVDFDSVTVGKMQIQVTDTGLTASRAPGDASKGFGSMSRKPLAGENVLVRSLAEAASQAIEKGLAKKAKKAAKKEAEPVKPEPVAVAAPVTSIKASGDVAETKPASTGPRQAGARRSTERQRGKRRKSSPPTEPKD